MRAFASVASRRETVLALIPVRRAISFVPSSALPSERASSTATARSTAGTWRTAGCPVRGIVVESSPNLAMALPLGQYGEDDMPDLPNKSTYVVIGGGVHGLSTAYHLALGLEASGRGS